MTFSTGFHGRDDVGKVMGIFVPPSTTNHDQRIRVFFFSYTPRSRRDARSRAALFRTVFPQPPWTFGRARRDRRFVTRTRTFHAHTFKVRFEARARTPGVGVRDGDARDSSRIRLGCGVRSACARGHRARGAATRERGMVRVARGMDWGEYRACVARACAGGCARACRGGGDWGNHGGRHVGGDCARLGSALDGLRVWSD